MTEASNLQTETTVQMDDTALEVSLEDPDMDDSPSGETDSASGELAAEHTGAVVSVVFNLAHLLRRVLTLFSIITNYNNNDSGSESRESTSANSNTNTLTVPRVAGNLENEIVEFIVVLRRYYRKLTDEELLPASEEWFRQLLAVWNTFLQSEQGGPVTSANISSDIKDDITRFMQWLEEEGEQLAEDDKQWTKGWLPRWNIFLQARAGQTLVTRCSVFLTIVGFTFYIVDLVSDVVTAIYYLANGQWWQAMMTLSIVYGAVIIYAVVKWLNDRIHCTGTVAWLRYVAASLVNWPDVKYYGALCRVEWQLHKSPTCSAYLVPEWHVRRRNVAHLKYMEGVWEACPQTILQLCLLVPDLYGHWTWTDYLRIGGACVSLCTAGVALVNWEKYTRINSYTDLPLSELVVLHVWAVPVTVSRLLSVTLVLSVHLYWALAGVALHLVLRGVEWCRIDGVPRTLRDVTNICLTTLGYFMTPFDVDYSVTYRRVYHAVHFLLNTAMMVVWALSTPLECAHPVLYTAIICFNAAMFVVGLVSWQIHEYRWPGSYP